VTEFVRLFVALDETNKTNEKVAALEHYFRDAPPEDAAWALALLTGRRPRVPVKRTLLRQWAIEVAGMEDWLFDECYAAVGDLAETISLVLPDRTTESAGQGLAAWLAWMNQLAHELEPNQRTMMREAWSQLDRNEKFVLHKLLGGSFRVGVSQELVHRAFARVLVLDKAVLAHRLMGDWQPTPEFVLSLAEEQSGPLPSQPYPFCLAYALEDDVESLGDPAAWLVEWKWDGIRAQLLRTADGVVFWSRGEERLDGRFPELEAAAMHLPEGCLLDGEILAWRDDAPLPFVQLQKRINRLKPGPRLLAECPLRFLAYDALFVRGEDLRGSPLSQRRSALEALLIESLSAPHCGPGVLEETWVRHPREGGDPDLSRPRPLLLDPVPAFARTGSSRGRRIPGSPESSSTAHPCNVAVRALQYDQSLRVLFLESPTGSSPGENPQVQAAAPSVGARRSARATAQVRASVESSADLPTPGVSAQASAPVSNDISAATVEGALLPETHESPDSVFGGRLPTLGISQRIDVRDWTAAEALRASARERGVEGLMLKRADSPWQPGRKRGAWWKWKLDPLSIDAVLIYAQAGHGRRATLYTDYTFALWDGEQLLPIAKAYSGLDDAEILRLDRWIRVNTLERFGPVRSVKAELVFELGFEGVNLSSRHKSGVALRFPRILRWREDKLAREADQLSALRRLAERLARAPAGPVE